MWDTCVRSLSWEDPLEKEMETHSSILAWRTEEPGRLQSVGLQRVRYNWRTFTSLHFTSLHSHWKDWCRAEAPVLWPPDAKSQLIRKDPDDGKDWGQKKRPREDEMVGLHHRLNGHEFEQTLEYGEGQGSLACCSPWGHKESDMTWRLNNKFVYVNIFIQKLSSLSKEQDTSLHYLNWQLVFLKD